MRRREGKGMKNDRLYNMARQILDERGRVRMGRVESSRSRETKYVFFP